MPTKREEMVTESRDNFQRPRTFPSARILNENQSIFFGGGGHFIDCFCLSLPKFNSWKSESCEHPHHGASCHHLSCCFAPFSLSELIILMLLITFAATEGISKKALLLKHPHGAVTFVFKLPGSIRHKRASWVTLITPKSPTDKDSKLAPPANAGANDNS